MEQAINPNNPTSFQLWVQAIRPFSFSASMIPVIVGCMYTLTYYNQEIKWYLVPIIIISSLLFHIGTNLVSEYYDLKEGVDRPDTFGSSRILVDSLMTPQKVLNGGLLSFAIGFILGLFLVYEQGTQILYLGIIGVLGGFFYTGKPVGYKYFALGDLLVFLLMGPLMVGGTFLALTGTYTNDVLIISIPIGLLVAAILHANNTRDILHDSQANVKTLAMMIGVKGSIIEYYFLVIGAYLSVILFVVFGKLEIWSLLVLISLVPAINNLKTIVKAELNKPENIRMMDIQTAQLHMMFGLLYAIGILISKFI